MKAFAARVATWQRIHGRHDLPWQQDRDPYKIWLSEIMLQQTQVATVLPYYARFVAAFPTVASLAAAPLDRVLAHWSGLGYYRRAHHLHAAANAVVRDHGGEFPRDAATLATLPGIGRSTAAAVAAFAADERGAILDGNVKRVLARHRGVEGWPGEPRVQAALWQLADALVPPDDGDIRAYTQGLMDIGATICTRTRPQCAVCPIRDDCEARLAGRVVGLPTPRPRKVLPQREVTLLLLERAGDVLLERRPSLGVWAGLWSLPELPTDADVAAHVGVQLALAPVELRRMPPITHAFTHFALTMHPVRVRVARASLEARMAGVEWFSREAALAAAIPAPIRRLLSTCETAEFRLTG